MKPSKNKKQRTYSFTLILGGMRAPIEAIEGSLFEAGCDDALVGIRNGATYLDFDREAVDMESAVMSAIQNVETSGIGANVLRVEPGDIVSQAEIARRIGKTREAVRLWSEGERGSGDFPPPVAGMSESSPLWSWSEVSYWLAERGHLPNSERVEDAFTILKINLALSLRAWPSHSNDVLSLRDRIEGFGHSRKKEFR